MAVTQHIETFRGDSKLLTIQIKDVGGAVFDLTGATVKWWLSLNPDSVGEDVLAMKSSAVGDGIAVIAPPTEGVIEIQLTKDDTDLIPAIYYGELKVFKGIDIATSMRGTVLIRAALSMPPGDPLVATPLLTASPEFGAPVLV